jgi:hypothetical protein
MPTAIKRSPSYPRIDLDRAVELAKKVYDSTFESSVDTETLYELMGYRGKSGPSASALSALKQYKLVEGRDQALRIAPLALRILHPANEQEKADALAEAVFAPQLYNEIRVQFSGKLPSDQVLKSYLVRTHSFNPNGADELIRILRVNRAHMERSSSMSAAQSVDETYVGRSNTIHLRAADLGETEHENDARSRVESDVDDAHKEILRFRISPTCVVRIIFTGSVSRSAIERTIQFLELAKDQYANE